MQQQWCGRFGKIEKCQVGHLPWICVAVGPLHRRLRLSLSQEWAKPICRCAKAGVPKEVRFQTRQDLMLEMLKEHGSALPHVRIAGDDELGRSSWFREQLRSGTSVIYLLVVPSNTPARDLKVPEPPLSPQDGHRRKTPFVRVHLGEKLKVAVHGLTIEQAQTAVTDALQRVAAKPFRGSIALAQMRGLQNIGGEHLVRPDGTISLGMYGSLHVADHTLAEVKSLVEKHLATYLVDPKVSVDVERYSSRNVYFINETGTRSVTALRHTAKMTVLDAFSRVQPSMQDARFQVRVVRITPKGDHVLPVGWAGIANHGRTETNYELQPGDRIHLSHNENVERLRGSNMAQFSTSPSVTDVELPVLPVARWTVPGPGSMFNRVEWGSPNVEIPELPSNTWPPR